MSEQPPESPRLNALGKPLSPSYDPNYKIKTPLSSINRLRAPMSPGVLRAPISPDEDQRWRAVRECVKKGDRAKAKAEDFYITAGQHLKALKDEHDKHNGTWAEWELKVKVRAGIGKSRASELMQIADGRKDIEQVRAEVAERKAKHLEKAKKISPFRNGENAPAPETAAEAMKAKFAELEDDGGDGRAPKRAKANDMVMPIEAEAEESYQETLYDQACLLLESMTDATLARFFAHLREKYHRCLGQMRPLVENAPPADVSAEIVSVPVAPPKKRGRPPGSKNKPKPPPAEVAVATAPQGETA